MAALIGVPVLPFIIVGVASSMCGVVSCAFAQQKAVFGSVLFEAPGARRMWIDNDAPEAKATWTPC